MSGQVSAVQLSPEVTLQFLDLAEKAVQAQNLHELAQVALSGLSRVLGAPAAALFINDERFHAPAFYHFGLETEDQHAVQKICAAHFLELAHSDGRSLELVLNSPPGRHLTLFPLRSQDKHPALLGLVAHGDLPHQPVIPMDPILNFLGGVVNSQVERLECEKRIAHLNTYLTVSSMIAQALDLRDVLEAVLYFSMEAVSAEAASVLLLDYEKKNLRFYSVEGPAKPVLLTATFPADQGLAGSILQSQQSEAINDVQHDPRFYGKIDSDSGFQTKNMIAIPLTAGEEKVGVLEVLNKIGGEPFYEEERLLLDSIAEEIAFAVRNGKLFEVVVKSYCKQRQGETSCRGCKRPLGSWTPCVKYREQSGV